MLMNAPPPASIHPLRGLNNSGEMMRWKSNHEGPAEDPCVKQPLTAPNNSCL
jgi:hypothetical protein